MIFVYVRSPASREIYVGTDYDRVIGVSPLTISRQPGTWTFSTVKDGAVDYRAQVTDEIDGANIILDLLPVVPPEPID